MKSVPKQIKMSKAEITTFLNSMHGELLQNLKADLDDEELDVLLNNFMEPENNIFGLREEIDEQIMLQVPLYAGVKAALEYLENNQSLNFDIYQVYNINLPVKLFKSILATNPLLQNKKNPFYMPDFPEAYPMVIFSFAVSLGLINGLNKKCILTDKGREALRNPLKLFQSLIEFFFFEFHWDVMIMDDSVPEKTKVQHYFPLFLLLLAISDSNSLTCTQLVCGYAAMYKEKLLSKKTIKGTFFLFDLPMAFLFFYGYQLINFFNLFELIMPDIDELMSPDNLPEDISFVKTPIFDKVFIVRKERMPD